MIRIIIADDHVLLLEGLALALAALPDIDVVGTATNGHELVDLARDLRPAVILTDIEMPGLNGPEAIAMLDDPPPTIFVTMYTGPGARGRATRAGAIGFLSKATPLPRLAAAVRAAAAGESFLEDAGLDGLLGRFRAPVLDAGASSLTDREREVLEAMAAGVTSTEELAATLFISHKTVKNHLGSIYAKLGVSDRARAVLEALRLGLVRNGSTGP